MRRIVVLGSLAAAWLIAADLFSQDPASTYRKATDDDYKKLSSTSQFVGLVADVGAKSITVKVDDTKYQMLVKQAMLLKEPQKTIYLNNLQNELKKTNMGKEYEFEFTAQVALRKLNLLFEYDERGNPKKYTSAELAKLKGTGNRPGYLARPDEIVAGMPVTVHLTRGKNNRPLASMVVVNNAPKPGQ